MKETLEQKIARSGQWFDKSRRDKEIQQELLGKQKALKINSTIVGYLSAQYMPVSSSNQEKTFRVGKRYNVVTLTPGDDFTNIGFTQEGVPFIATGTTPTLQTTSYVSYLNCDVDLMFNDVDPNLVIELQPNPGGRVEFKITNSSFKKSKTYVVAGASPIIVNDNLMSAATSSYFFKIEVYN